MKSRQRRAGFTLIELLVVIGIILVLATLAIFIAPRLSDDERITRSSDQLQGWFMIQKNRAHRDQIPRGIRLVPDPEHPNFVTHLYYIEQPEDWKGGTIQIPSPFAPGDPPLPPPLLPGSLATCFVANKDLLNEGIVTPGDNLLLDSYETVPLNSHRIYQVEFLPQNGNRPAGTRLVFGAQDNSVPSSYRPVAGPIGPGEANFRIVRQPRVMVGEQPLQLPREAVIDLANNFGFPALTTDGANTVLPGGSLDILFGSRGQVIGANAIGGKIILRLRGVGADWNMPSDQGDQILIVIHTRTGMVTTHPVNISPPFGMPGHDPYMFVRDGKASGM
jgi:prepilin-type N-terminal cleavage/methylation domain-containing protein